MGNFKIRRRKEGWILADTLHGVIMYGPVKERRLITAYLEGYEDADAYASFCEWGGSDPREEKERL